MLYVRAKFGMLPFSAETVKVAALLTAMGVPFYFLGFPFHPVVNIALKGLLIIIIYIGVLYRYRISEDVFGVLSRFLKR